MKSLTLAIFLTAACQAFPPAIGADSGEKESVVLLKNRAVLRGTVIEEPGYILIRDGASEIRLPRDGVACWAPSIGGLHRYLIDTRDGSTLESHLAVARWCVRNRYPAGAVAEIIAARRLDPDNTIADQLERELREWHTRRDTERSSDGTDVEVSVDLEDEARETHSGANLDDQQELSESIETTVDRHLAGFTSDIQPILLNRCGQATCHGTPGKRPLSLERPFKFAARPNAEMSRRNLRNVLTMIDFDHLEASPLLVKALQPHADLESSPLRPQDRIAAQQLRKWVMGLSKSDGMIADIQVGTGQVADDVSVVGKETDTGRASNRVVRVPEVEDPFDPEVFNRRFHPDRRNEW